MPMDVEQMPEDPTDTQTAAEKRFAKLQAKWARESIEKKRLHELKPVQEQFHHAISWGNFDKVKAFLVAGEVEVNFRCKNNTNSPLHRAATRGDVKILELVLKHGADVRRVNSSGNTALISAVLSAYHRRFEAVVIALLLHGSDVDASGPDGATALHHAVTYGSSAMVRILLDHGADISVQDNRGANPLHALIFRKPQSIPVQTKICRMLLDHGSDTLFKLYVLRTYDYGIDDSDNSDSEDDDSSYTPGGLADLMNKPVLADMMEKAEDKLEGIARAVSIAYHARVASELRAKKTAFAMGHHARLGKDSHVLTLAPDVLQMILKHV